MIERELQLYQEHRVRVTLEQGVEITIEHPHILFDVQLGSTLRRFLDILDQYYAPARVFEELRSPGSCRVENPLFVFEQAIDEFLGLPDHYHTLFANRATENSVIADDFESWEEFATLWFWQYLSTYNEELHDSEPDSVADLKESITTLQQSDTVPDQYLCQILDSYRSKIGVDTTNQK